MEAGFGQSAVQNTYTHPVLRPIMQAAGAVLDDLEERPTWEPGQTRRWSWTDKVSFLLWNQLESHLPEVDGAALRNALVEPVNTLHTALPYSEAERHWLVHTSWRSGDTGSKWLARTRQQEVQLISNGLIRIIYGRDLVRRWWAWRRQTDEYTGQDSLSLACDGLTGIITAISRVSQ